MRDLLPYLILYRYHFHRLIFGIVLTIFTLLASIALLGLSGWFLSATAIAGFSGLYSFNYMLPAAGVRSAAIIRTFSRWLERVVNHDSTFRILQYLRLYIFMRIIPLSPGAIPQFKQAELLNLLVADVDTLDHFYLRIISPLIGALVVTFVITISLCSINKQSGLIVGIAMLAVLVLFPPLFYYIGKPIGETLAILRNDYRFQLNSWLSNNAELMLYGADKLYRQQLDITAQNWQKYQSYQSGLSSISQSFVIIVVGLTLTVVLWLTASDVINNELSSSFIAMFAFVTVATFEVINPVTNAFQYLGYVISSAKRLNTITNQSPTVTFTAHDFKSINTSISIGIHSIQFRYPGQSVIAINDLSLSVSAGKHVAFIGHTGSGKSTLINLLTRAWDPENGLIKLNNIPLREWSENALRRSISVVPQRVHIFSATLRDNLTLAAKNANDEKLCLVLKQLGMEKFLQGEGLDVWIGEGGRALSGGEQRRIAIARVILHDAPLWLFDEPTEGLDAITEQKVLKLLKVMGKEKTVVIVTHRLWGLEHLDCIYVMDRGKIIEQGSHTALIKQRGAYYNYYCPLRK